MTKKVNYASKPVAPTVIIIGCGPSGISFLHALAYRKKLMEDEGDLEGLSKLPIVTCFERASEPGGVWVSQRSFLASDENHPSETDSSTEDYSSDGESSSDLSSSDEEVENRITEHCTTVKESSTTNMYEALWTNGPKESFEFFDYTFEDHFKHPLPVFMPRQHLLEYIIKRVTRHNPDIFKKHVKFNTQVNYVRYNEATSKFTVNVQDRLSNIKSTLTFDKCIWGAGENGVERIPQSIRNLLRKQEYLGRKVHSSSAGSCLHLVKGQRILLIGDAYSAEDLALQAIKLDVEKVYILSRTGNGICLSNGAWPRNKVKILQNLILTGVEDGYNLHFSEAAYDVVKSRYNLVSGKKTVELKDISTVIYCTGYEMNLSMLDPSLKIPFEEEESECFEIDRIDDWTMTTNALTESLGNVKPSEDIYGSEVCVYHGMYRGILTSNHNMMFSVGGEIHIPLLEIDVRAWFFLRFIMGDYVLPSTEEVERLNMQVVIEAMQIPSQRYLIDMNYQAAWLALDKNHWSMNDLNPTILTIEEEANRFVLLEFTKELQDAGYPLNIGTSEKLNEKGELLLMLSNQADMSRVGLDPKSEDAHWKTFRDVDPSNFVSLHSGNEAVCLKKRWLDLDDHDPNLLKNDF